ncbi:MAG: PAS domain S-box protein [Magnetococcales bacterium]|nr:PAS domain S-box protein [Magnetococcales bacterium]
MKSGDIVALPFSLAEKRYLQSKKVITMCIDPDWMPYESIDAKGRHLGMSADYMKIFSARIGIPIKLVPTVSWSESLEFAKARRCDILSLLNESPERRKFLAFTPPYVESPIILVTRDDVTYLEGVAAIGSRTLSTPKGYIHDERLRQDFPELNIVTVPTVYDGLLRVSKGEVFSHLGSLYVVVNEIQKRQLSNLKISGHTRYHHKLAIGVRNDDATLLDILSKAVKSINQKEHIEIRRSWTATTFAHEFDYSTIHNYLISGLLFIGVILFWNRKLSKLNQRIKESEDRYRTLLEIAPDGVIVHSDGVVRYANQTLVDMLNLKSEKSLIGKPVMDIVHPDYREQVEQRIQEVQSKSGEIPAMRQQLLSFDGRTINIEAKGRRIDLDNKPASITILRDITDAISLEEDLRQAKELAEKATRRNQLILDAAGEGIYGLDLEGITTFVNPAAAKMIGWKQEDLIGLSQHNVLHHSHADGSHYNSEDCPIYAALHDGKTHNVKDEVFWRKDGSSFPVEYVSAPIIEMDKILGAVVIFRDITERNKLEESLKVAKEQAEHATKAKSAFLAAMSHDIRTPMNAILGMGEVLIESGLDQDQRRALKILTNAGENLLALINDILDLSKIEAGQLHMESVSFDLHELCKGTHHILHQNARAKGIAFECRIQPNCPHIVVGDPQRVRQVLLNILGNALKFTDNGKVTITVGAQNEDLIRFSVSDTGIGIEKSKLAHIFAPFRQADDSTSRRFGGTGLGLSICSQLVKAMGGTIKVESDVGKGSTFLFTARLPGSKDAISDDKPAHVVRAKERAVNLEQSALEKSLKILLVDDAEDNRMVITSYLNKSSYQIIEAVNGEEAVRMFKSSTFDIVLMDMQMPVLDGIGATIQIRAWEKEQGRSITPIIALTANAMREDIDRTVAAGCDFHLSKPIGKARLVDVIRSFYKESGPAGSSEISTDQEHFKARPATDGFELLDKQKGKGLHLINRGVLEQLRLDFGGDIKPTLTKFLQKLPNRIETIANAIDNEDADELSAAAHTLKGAASLFGAEIVAEICFELEMQGRSGHIPDAGKLANLMAEGERVQEEIKNILAEI